MKAVLLYGSRRELLGVRQLMLRSKKDQLKAIRDAQLVKDVGQVMFDGVLAQRELLRHIFVRAAF